jgi:hypothetical protein
MRQSIYVILTLLFSLLAPPARAGESLDPPKVPGFCRVVRTGKDRIDVYCRLEDGSIEHRREILQQGIAPEAWLEAGLLGRTGFDFLASDRTAFDGEVALVDRYYDRFTHAGETVHQHSKRDRLRLRAGGEVGEGREVRRLRLEAAMDGVVYGTGKPETTKAFRRVRGDSSSLAPRETLRKRISEYVLRYDLDRDVGRDRLIIGSRTGEVRRKFGLDEDRLLSETYWSVVGGFGLMRLPVLGDAGTERTPIAPVAPHFGAEAGGLGCLAAGTGGRNLFCAGISFGGGA